jgi:hypothetical protein
MDGQHCITIFHNSSISGSGRIALETNRVHYYAAVLQEYHVCRAPVSWEFSFSCWNWRSPTLREMSAAQCCIELGMLGALNSAPP